MIRKLLGRLPRLRMTRWPTTPEEWGERAKNVRHRLRQASIEVAEQIGANDLAAQMRACPEDAFPAAEFLGELNLRSKGAGDRALGLAESRRPHH